MDHWRGEAHSRPGTFLSVVVPCYLDEQNMEPIFDRVFALFDTMSEPCELIVVDDGSPDGTARRARELLAGARHPVTLLRLAKNFGQHPAVVAGLAGSSGRVVVTIDSDLQYAPEDVPLLLEALTEDVDVVSGVRAQRADAARRGIATRLIGKWIERQTGRRLADAGSMFRAYTREAVELILAFPERRPYLPALAAYLGLRTVEVEVTHQSRGDAGTRYRMSTLFDLLFDIITGYSIAPLRIASILGFFGASAAFLASLTLVVYRIVQGDGPSGLVTAFAALFFLVAILMAQLTLVGETLGRVYLETRGHPRSLVRSVEVYQ